MTYKQIEAGRGARLWVGLLVVPAVSVAAAALVLPGVRRPVAAGAVGVLPSVAWGLRRRGR